MEPNGYIGSEKKLTTIFLIGYPFFSQFKIGSGGLDVGTVLVAFVLFLVIIPNSRISKQNWLVFSLYLIVSTAIAINLGFLTRISLFTCVIRIVKILLALVLVSFSCSYLNPYAVNKYYLKFCDIATYMIFIQYILFFLTHRSLIVGGYFAFRYTSALRPCSIFGEPSQYTNYLMVALILSIFSNSQDPFYKDFANRKKLYCIGILLSTSGQGYAILALTWVMYILYNGFIQGKLSNAILTTLGLVIIAFFAMKIPIVQNSVGRFFDASTATGYSSAVTGRLVGFKYLKEFTPLQLAIGTGFGNRVSGIAVTGGVIYYNGISSIISGSGWIGLLLFAWCSFGHVKYAGSVAKITVALIFALMFSANLFYAPYIVLYFVLLSIVEDVELYRLQK